MAARDEWLGHVLDRARWRPQRTAVALATLGLFVAVIMGALYLSQSSHQSALGRQLNDMIAERNTLEQSVEQLRAEIAILQSMPRLQARAEAMGFEPAGANQIIYIVVDGYDPEREIEIVPLASDASGLPEYNEDFGGWLGQLFDEVGRQLEAFGQEAE
ncbi:MAG: hypothetical protein IPK19_11780 [Chloroflexi bacterium]|nr:hypothetical protein [Chloroflexota bacterium]